MNAVPRDLSALISSRICHDLINPIGAISNGLELLETIGKSWGPELDLVADSVANASAKINYFRIAFGDAAMDSELRSVVVGKTIADMFNSTRLKTEFAVPSEAVPRPDTKLLLLVLLCLDASLPLGGILKVTREDGRWNIAAKGPRTKFDEELWQMLATGETDPHVGAGEVQFAVACQTAAEAGLRIEPTFANDGATVVITR